MVLAVIFIPLIVYIFYPELKDYYQRKNAIQIDFRREDGKIKGYKKSKKGEWIYDETLELEDPEDSIDDTK